MPHLAKNSTSSSSDIFADTTSPSSLDDYPSRLRSLSVQPVRAGPLTPAVPGFDFSDLDSPTNFADSDAAAHRADYSASSPPMKDQDWDAQSIRSTKSTKSVKSLKNWRSKSVSTKDEAKRKTQFFEDKFAYKEGWETHAVDQARAISPVVAELRTNVIIKDEYSLVTELSGHFAARYQRPESAIMISIAHSQCLMFGGTFEPAYILTMSAVESHCQAATNKRNAVVTQGFLSEVLGVTEDRGVVRFNPIREDCLATNGRTVSGEIDKLDSENGGGLKKALTASRRKSQMAPMKRRGTNASEMGQPTADAAPKNRKTSMADRRKSFMSIGGRKSPTEQKEKEKQKKNRISLHPPNIEEMSDRESRSSTPEVPAPVFIGANGQPAERNGSVQINGSTVVSKKQETVDETRGLLSEASRKLSAMDVSAQPKSPRPSAQPQSQTQPQPHMSALPPPSPGYTNHSRPTSRSRSASSHSQTPTQHVSQLLQNQSHIKHGQPLQQTSQLQHRRQSRSPHIAQQQSPQRLQSPARKSMSHQQLRKPMPLQPHNAQPRQTSPLQQSNGFQHQQRPAPAPAPAPAAAVQPPPKASLPPPPAIPDDKPLPQKISKRKSLIQMFRTKS